MIKKIKKILGITKKEDSWKPIDRPELPAFYFERKIDRLLWKDYPGKRFGLFEDFFKLNSIKANVILFIDTTQNSAFTDYLNQNKNQLSQKLSKKGRNLVLVPEISSDTDGVDYKYFFPNKEFAFNKWDGFPKSNYENFDKSLLDFLGYEGTIKTGVLSIFITGISFVEKLETETISDFWDKYVDNMLNYSEIIKNKPPIFYSVDKDSDEIPYFPFDKETNQHLNDIDASMKKLVESGNFFLVAPMIKKMLDNVSVLNKISPLHITSDFRILLPDYDLEIEMGHLTKSIYFLFLLVDKPIDLQDMSEYENQLLEIYKEVSNRECYNSLQESVSAVTRPKNEFIYMHFSRIKSAFAKKLTPTFGLKYIVNGRRGHPKSIKLNRKLVKWDSEIAFARLQK